MVPSQNPSRGIPPGGPSRGGQPPGRQGPGGPSAPGAPGNRGGGNNPGGPQLGRAVPQYLRQAPDHLFSQAPPGHRFRLYFKGWTERWELSKDRKCEIANEVTQLDDGVRKAIEALHERLESLASGGDLFTKTVSCSAPFTTGLGIEHPLENGFAFLDPYGLPYLPGSSVKGVVRRAAEELALFETDSHGWSVPAIWWLFGFDANSALFAPDAEDEPQPILDERARWREALRSHLERLAPTEVQLLETYLACARPRKTGEKPLSLADVLSWIPNGGKAAPQLRELHTRGALEFWDVIPEPKDGKLRVDIMNPHYGHYYQQGQPPGDWGSPIPIFFLTLPPGTRFTFISRFRPPLNWPDCVRRYFETTEDGVPRWKRLVEAAFAFAFDWLGFGAKTAVGYGRMASQWYPPRVEQPTVRQPSGSPGSGHHEPRATGGVQRGAHAANRVAVPEKPRSAGSELGDLEGRIARIASAHDIRSEADVLSNELVRKRSHPDAPRLAAALWMAVREKQWLADRLRRNPMFVDLVEKGGGE